MSTEHVLRLELQDARREIAALREALAASRAELRASREASDDQCGRLDALLSAAPVGICYADREGGLVLFNAEIERLWGAVPPTAVVGDYAEWKGWWADQSARHGQPVEAHEWPLARALAGERVEGDVIEIQPFGGGARRTVIYRAAPVLDGAGAIVGSVIAVTEASRQLQVEQALRLNEERFRSLVQSSAQIVWISDPSGRKLVDSPTWLASTGQSREECEGEGWLDAVHPDDRARVGATWAASLAAQTPYESEFRMRTADGAYRWTIARGHPILGADGKVREWVGTAADIHDRRMAEDASREWRRRLEAILEAGDVGTWTLDLGSDRFHADANIARLFGVPAAAAHGVPVRALLRAVHPDDVEAVRVSLARAVREGEPHQIVHRLRRPDGSEVTVNARGRVEYGADGRPARLSGVVLDISRQVETERLLRTSESARLRGEQRYRTVLNSIDVAFCIIEMIFDAQGEPWDSASWRPIRPSPSIPA